jgi:hypothetical protein
MKKLIFALTVIFSHGAVNAGQILPDLYAYKYCEMRALGLSSQDAANVATDEAYISTGNSFKVKWNGIYVDADVLQAAAAAYKRCPKFMK